MPETVRGVAEANQGLGHAALHVLIGRVEIETKAQQADDSLPRVRARADQLRQVFLNLIINAQQAIEGDGEIVISTSRYEQALQPSILVQLTDTGVGIAEDDLTRIFDPFFSTGKKGTGLGLWVTQDIVRQHGGRIEVSSEVGRNSFQHCTSDRIAHS